MYLSVIIAEFEQLAFIGPDIVVTPLFAPIFDCICYVITLCTKKQHTVIEKQNSKYEAFSVESFFFHSEDTSLKRNDRNNLLLP